MEIKSKPFYVKCFLVFWNVCVLTIAHASDTDLVVLPEMVVSNDATDKPHKAPDSNTIINRASLDAANRADLNGVLRGLPSIGLSQSNGSTTSGVILRGASGGLGLVNLDGIPLFGTFTGFFPLSHYPLDLLDRVSVARGNDQTQGSSRTLGGAINLTSRQLNDGQAFCIAKAEVLARCVTT